MKVKFEKEAKKYITIDKAPIVHEIILDMKEDESTPAEYAEMAIQAAYDGRAYDIEVLRSSAKIAQNCRAWDCYNDHSSDIDIWIEDS